MDAELDGLVLHFFLKKLLPENLLRVIRHEHGRHLIALLDLVELLANISDSDGLIANLGHHVGGQLGGTTRTCRYEIEQHAAGQCQDDNAKQDAGKKFLLIL